MADRVLIRDYVIGAIIFTMLIVGGISIISELLNNNPEGYTNNETEQLVVFDSTFNKYVELKNSTDNLQEGVMTNEGTGILGTLDALIQGSWVTLKNTFTTFAFMSKIFTSLHSFFPFIPEWVSTFIVLIVTTMIAYVIFSAIYQKDV